MATTIEQDDNYYVSLLDVPARRKLQTSIFWIGMNLHPYDVFTYDQLSAWALENGFVKTATE